MVTKLVDIHKINGKRPDYDIYIGRAVNYTEFTRDSKWANYYGKNFKRYEFFVRNKLWNDLNELKGKKLGCWCITTDKIKPVICHGQILLKLIKEKFGK